MGCNNNSNSGTNNNGRCSKKQKQKQRVPQRGLGVAQLEKIRLEEQHHHHGIFPPPSSAIVIPPTQATTKTSSSSISKVQSHLSVSNFPTFQSSQKNLRHRHSLYGSFHGYNKRSNDYSGEASCSGGEGFPFWGSSSGSSRIPNESNPKPNPTLIWPIQRAAHHQQYESMVGIPTPNSSSSSTIINFHQMEPPSNQSFYSNLSSTGDWAAEEEEKTIGMKRAHPLSNYEQDSISIAGAGAGSSSVPLPLPPPPSFMMYQSSSSMKKQYPSVVHHHHHHESPSSFNFGSGPVFNFTSSNPPYFRDGSSGWNVTWQPDSRRAARDNNAATPIPTTTFPGEFLTLGISNTTPTTSRRQRQVSDSSFFHHPKMFELEPSNHSHHHHHHHHQGLNEEEDSAGDSRQQRVCHAGSSSGSGSLFLPSKFMQDETNSVEHVDLNLKL